MKITGSSSRKVKRCVQCGCDRVWTVIAAITVATSGTTAFLKRLCIPCFLKTMDLVLEPQSKKTAMACVSDFLWEGESD